MSRPWHRPNPSLPFEKPTYTRGCDESTATRLIILEEPSSKIIEALVSGDGENRTVSLKRSFFTAFDAYELQDKALPGPASDLHDARDATPPPKKIARPRRDSTQDKYSPPSSPLPTRTASPKLPASPAPTEPPKAAAVPSIVKPSTEQAPPKPESSAPLPKGLKIDGNPGFDPHKDDEQQTDDADMITTYLYRGQRYEVQGNEPEAWLKELQKRPRHPKTTAAGANLVPPRDRRSLSTPGSVASSRTGRPRRSVGLSVGGESRENGGRRRSSRRG